MQIRSLPSLALATLVLLAGCVAPPPRHEDGGWHDRDRHAPAQIRVVFTDRERAMIRDYYDQRRKSLPPGLAKKHKIPPGHEKQLAEGRMPPGLQHRYLPPDLERRLPSLPGGYVRVVIDADVAIMNTRTRVIVDVLRGIADD